MSAKPISEISRFRMDFVALPLSAKVAITITLASLGIILIATVQQVPIKKIPPAFLMDRITAVDFRPSTLSSGQLFLAADEKEVVPVDQVYSEISGKITGTEPAPQMQGGTTHISIKVDRYPFFADEFDHNTYE